MNNTETIYKVGDHVWCPAYGWGEVTDIIEWASHPIKVKFELETWPSQMFTLDGRLAMRGPVCLFFTEQQYSVEKPAWKPKPGEWCWFWDDDQDGARLLHFGKMWRDKYETKSGVCWDKCAPFTGELPPHLKEVQP